MRFDEISKHYPWICDLFESVAERTHAGSAPHQTLQYIQRRHAMELTRIQEKHLLGVTGKLLQFAQAIYESKPFPTPKSCPYCGSIENNGVQCNWCHENISRGVDYKHALSG